MSEVPVRRLTVTRDMNRRAGLVMGLRIRSASLCAPSSGYRSGGREADIDPIRTDDGADREPVRWA